MEKTLTYLFKILVVLGFVFLALMFIVPIVCGIVNPDGEIGVTLGKVFLILFLIDGSFLAILMPVGYCLLIKTKIDKHPITSSNVDDLLNSLRDKLHTGGYLFVKEGNSKYGPMWVYKKSRPIHDDYFIVLFCCDGLNKKNVTELIDLSREGLNQGCLTAVADFQNSTLSFKKITDGFAEKRQHKYIKVLLSFF